MRYLRTFLILALFTSALAAADEAQPGGVLPLSAVRRGFSVVLGAEPDLAAALHAQTGLGVQCLVLEAEAVGTARAALAGKGLCGPVTVSLWREKQQLPYADHLVTCLVVTDADAWSRAGLPMEEMQRVVAPYGTLAFRGGQIEPPVSNSRRENGWTLWVKPWPEEMDEWRQYGYDASGSMQSNDSLVGPVRSVRWVGGAYWHGAMNQPTQIVSAGGRLYAVDTNQQGPGDSLRPPMIVARDAFNGLQLWERRVSADWRQLPLAIALGERVYVPVPENNGHYVALDGASGEIVARYSFGGKEVKYHEGVFLSDGGQKAWDVETGALLWEAAVEKFPERSSRDMGLDPRHEQILVGDFIYVIDEGELTWLERRDPKRSETGTLVCRGLRDGQVRWAAPLKQREWLMAADAARLLTMDEGVSVSGDLRGPFRRTLRAYASSDGRFLWSYEFEAVFKGRVMEATIGDEVLLHISRLLPGQPRASTMIASLDAATGEERRAWVIDGQALSRCHPRRSTGDYLLLPDGSLVESDSGEQSWTRALRGACRFGYVPANGLFYQGLNKCMCNNSLRGWAGFAPDETFHGEITTSLEKGPAYGTAGQGPEAGRDDWPVHRGNALRHGASTASVPPDLGLAWTADLPARSSAPVVVGNAAYLSLPDQHQVVATSLADGQMLWRFIAEGRVDSPPTYWRGLLLFGCSSGWVYALDAASGELAWRLRAAPSDGRIVARGSVESRWPLHGSVLVEDGIACVAAGRHVDLDGGIFFHAIDAATGTVRWSRRIGQDHIDAARIRRGFSALPTLMQSDGRLLYMDNDLTLDRASGDYVVLSDAEREELRVMWGGALGFLNEDVLVDWLSGQSGGRKNWRYQRYDGEILAVNQEGGVFGVAHRGSHTTDHTWRNRLRGWGGADSRLTIPGSAIFGAPPDREPWMLDIPGGAFRVKALLVTDDRLYVAVAPDMGSKDAGELWVLSTLDGKRLATHPLGTQPLFDGMALSGAGVFIATEKGQLMRFAAGQ